MIRLAICDDDPRTLEEAGQIIQACGREGLFQQLIEVDAFQSSQALADNVEDGELYDVFLLDVEMPGLDGISLGWRIRQKQPDAVILFLTSCIISFKVNIWGTNRLRDARDTIAVGQQGQVLAPLVEP